MKNKNQLFFVTCDQCGETYPHKGWTKERTITNKDGSVDEVVNLCRTNKCEAVYVEDNKLNRTGAYPRAWCSVRKASVQISRRESELYSDGVDYTRSTDLVL